MSKLNVLDSLDRSVGCQSDVCLQFFFLHRKRCQCILFTIEKQIYD